MTKGKKVKCNSPLSRRVENWDENENAFNYGVVWESTRICFQTRAPNDPITERAPIPVPGFHSFQKRAI